MERPGTLLLLLLLTSTAAVQYHWKTEVSLPGPAVQTTSAVSESVCAVRCKELPSEECSGFIYDEADGTCRLFSGDCRGPAASSSQQTTERYMARSNCPGISSDRCGCPAGFSRCAGRCLARLAQAVTYAEAEVLCAELGAHLAVPRSEAENQCAITAATDADTWLFLGFTDVVTEGTFVGADGCGVVPSDDPAWGRGQPNNANENQHYGQMAPPSSSMPGWHDNTVDKTYLPLCQLAFCYQSGCQ